MDPKKSDKFEPSKEELDSWVDDILGLSVERADLVRLRLTLVYKRGYINGMHQANDILKPDAQ